MPQNLDELSKPLIWALPEQNQILQKSIFEELNRINSTQSKKSTGTFLCSFELNKNQKNNQYQLNLISPFRIPSEYIPQSRFFLEGNNKLCEEIAQIIFCVLQETKQLEYIDSNIEYLINDKQKIIIDFDVNFERTQDEVGFHTDSTGMLMFVNLIYNNQKGMIYGPEYIPNRLGREEYIENISSNMSHKFIDDVIRQYNQSIFKKYKIYKSIIPKNGIFSFVDAAVYHSTSSFRNRRDISPYALHTFLQSPDFSFYEEYNKLHLSYIFERKIINNDAKKSRSAKYLELLGISPTKIKQIWGFLYTNLDSTLTNESITRYRYLLGYHPTENAFLITHGKILLEIIELIYTQRIIEKDDLMAYTVFAKEFSTLFANLDTIEIDHYENHDGMTPVKRSVYSIHASRRTPISRQMSKELLKSDRLAPSDEPRQFVRISVHNAPRSIN